MSYGIMHYDKRNKSAVYGIQMENNRDEQAAKDKAFVNSIDYERTRDNVYLLRSDNWNESINEKLNEYGLKARKNSVLLIDTIYSASPDWFENKSQEEILDYFRACLAFQNRYFGESINAVIHFDETTPHMHVVSVPLYRDTESGKMKLSARDLVGNRKKMQATQDAYYNEVSSKYGLERGERYQDGAEVKEYLQLQEYKKSQNEKMLAEQQSRIDEIDTRELLTITKEIDISEREKHLQQKEIALEKQTEQVKTLLEKLTDTYNTLIDNMRDISNTLLQYGFGDFAKQLYKSFGSELSDAGQDISEAQEFINDSMSSRSGRDDGLSL